MRAVIFLLTVTIGTICAIREIPYTTKHSKIKEEQTFQYKVVVPPVQTKKTNRYICYSKSLEEIGESYVTSLLTEPDQTVSPHHVDVGLCLEPQHEDSTWECKKGRACKGDAVEFSVTDNFNSVVNPFYVLPKDVSSRIGDHGKKHFLIVQIHLYEPLTKPKSPANITITYKKNPSKFNYQKYMLSNSGTIPAYKPGGYFSHNVCEWKRPKAFAFDYYVHTHSKGFFAEGFLIRNTTWIYLGGQKTQERSKVWFKILNGPVELQPGDILASRCLFINNDKEPAKLPTKDTCIFQLSVGYDIKYHDYFARPAVCMSPSPEMTFCNNNKTAALCDNSH